MTYFIRIRGKAFGPFDEEQLLNMKSQGKLSKIAEVSENKTDWQPAESLEFLFPKTGANVFQQAPEVSTDWFYSLNGTEGYGPVAATIIEQMLRSGQLNSNSYVWKQGQNARLVKNEPLFSGSEGAAAPMGAVSTAAAAIAQPLPMTKATTGNMASIGGEVTGTSEQLDTGKVLRPIAATLGWMMLLKIVVLLIGVIVQGLHILWTGIFSISHAVGSRDSDAAAALFVTLIVFALISSLYALQFKTFLCLWKYHNSLYKTVASGRASDLIQSNQNQYLFWKWLGITVIAWLSLMLVLVTAMIIVAAYGSELSMLHLFRYVLLFRHT